MISVAINSSGFTAEFSQVLDKAKKPEGMLKVVGRELANRLRAHFRKKDATEPNPLSPRREHFWLQVMRSVNAPELHGDRSVGVRVSDPRIAQKVFGGTIVPKRAGALSIPVEERAYARTPATFEVETGLKLFLVKTGKSDFERAVLAVKGEGNGQIQVEYVLAKSVRQDPDPTALPAEADLERAILERAKKYLENEKN